MYFFAIETTRRRLASTSSFFACSACHSPRMIVSSVCFSSSGACSSASVITLSFAFSSLICRSDFLPVLFLQLLLLVLRIEQPVGRLDLALHRPDAFDRVLHLVDQAAFHRFGELDPADAAATARSARASRPIAPAVLPLFAGGRALRRLGQLLLELFGSGARLADGVDLLLHLTRALLDALVGDFLVVEDDQLADGPLAGVSLSPNCDHPFRDQRRARDRLDDRQLAALDPAGDLDFAFARQQRHGAHLAQVHAHRVVGLVERAGRQVELQLLGAFGRPVNQLDVVAQVFLIGVDDFDAGAAEGIEEVVELVGRRNLRRQEFVHLVVEEVALFLADVDELPDFVVPLFNRAIYLSCLRLRQFLDAME